MGEENLLKKAYENKGKVLKFMENDKSSYVELNGKSVSSGSKAIYSFPLEHIEKFSRNHNYGPSFHEAHIKNIISEYRDLIRASGILPDKRKELSEPYQQKEELEKEVLEEGIHKEMIRAGKAIESPTIDLASKLMKKHVNES